MTIEELRRHCDERDAWARRLGSESFMVLVLPRLCKGETARVFPGVTGRVLETRYDNTTVVRVKTADVRMWLDSAKEPAP